MKYPSSILTASANNTKELITYELIILFKSMILFVSAEHKRSDVTIHGNPNPVVRYWIFNPLPGFIHKHWMIIIFPCVDLSMN